MSYDFVAANSVTVAPSIGIGTQQVIWSSAEISQGSNLKAVTAACTYEAVTPDGETQTPSGVQMQFVVEVKDSAGGWEEIGRQNTPITKLEQGAVRTILVNPSFGLQEEGVDQFIQGLNGTTANVKSKFDESAEGTLRVCLVAIDRFAGDPQPHPFSSVTFSVAVKRYDPA